MRTLPIRRFIASLPLLCLLPPNAVLSAPPAALPEPAAAMLEPEVVPGELLVKFKRGVPASARDARHQSHGNRRLRRHDGLDIDHIALPHGGNLQEARRRYRADPDVEYAEPNYVVRGARVPNDTYFRQQWALENIGQYGGPTGIDIDAPRAWDLSTGSAQVVVALLDSGVDYTHPDLAPNMWVNEAELNGLPGVDDDGNGSTDDVRGIDAVNGDLDPMDDVGHGTHVAGIIGARGDDAGGVAGINWNVRILSCKFLNVLPGGSLSGSIAHAITCLEYVRRLKARGVNIVATNNSWGAINAYSQALRDAIDAQRDILFFAAAGNFSMDNDQMPYYPASYELPNVVSVAATNYLDGRPVWSHYGRRSVHIGAPGDSVFSSSISGGFAVMKGTSMATPHASGVAALLKAQDPARDWRALKNLILAGGDPAAGMAGATISGRRVNAATPMTCSNRPLFSAVKVPTAITLGQPATLSALSINCAVPVGPVTATTSDGLVITLRDDGQAPDLAAGDGLFTGSFVPTTSFTYMDYSSPIGSERVGMPDLAVSAVSAPSAVDLGGAITVTATVSNLGPIATAASTLSFYLSSDATVTTADTPLGSVSTFALAAGGQQVVNAVLSVPPGLAPGNYTIGAIVDSDNLLLEGSETNNAAAGNWLRVGPPPVDLALSAVTAPASGNPGNPISVGATVFNGGGSAAAASTLSFYLSSDATITANDTLLGTVALAELPAGTSTTVGSAFTIPPALAAGNYYVGAIADSANVVAETNETNNSRAAAAVTAMTILPVDLTLSTLSGPSAATVGQQVTFWTTLRNLGTATAAAPTVTFYLSTDATITSADTPIGTVSTAALAGGGQRSISATLPIPGTVTAGTYYVGAIADSARLIPETNENNNARTGNLVALSVAADLVVSQLWAPATAVTGQVIAIDGEVWNQGYGAVGLTTWVGFYLSKDANITTADRYIGNAWVSPLAAGGYASGTVEMQIPTNLSPGIWYVGAIADYDRRIAESNESNNATVAGAIVIGIGPDLTMTAVAGPTSATPGATVTFTGTVANQGLGAAEVVDASGVSGKSRVAFYLSTDPTVATTDLLLGSVMVDRLAAGQAVPVSLTVKLPSTLVGTYYIGAIADYQNQLTESNESNNSLAGNTLTLSVGSAQAVTGMQVGP